jgi:hypothetical protein
MSKLSARVTELSVAVTGGGHNVQWVRDRYAAMQPFVGAKRYLNCLESDDAGSSALAAAYGPNLPRLREIKKKYDPENVFRVDVNIPPA